MANNPSAAKRNRQSLKRRERNRAELSRVRTAVKRLRTLITARDRDGARQALARTLGIVDAAARKGVLHRNTASRTKSRLAKAVNGL